MPLNNLYQDYPPTSRVDFFLFFLVFLFLVFGLVMITSSSTLIGLNQYKDSFFFVKRHIVFMIIGFFAFLSSYVLPHFVWRKFAFSLWVLSLLFVALTYIPGVGMTVGGSSRWIYILGLRFQPSEVLKFTLILYMAHLLDINKDRLFDFKNTLLPLLAVIGISIVVVLKQPDLGTSIVIGAVSFLMMFIAGTPAVYLSGICFSSLLVVIISIIKNPYQMNRVTAFLNPWNDPYGTGFHVIQSLIAVGTGGLFGLGLGESRQKFFYLPQQYTDFIFSIVCEEFGFIFTTFFILCFLFFVFRAFLISSRCPHLFSKLLVIGLCLWITLQAIVNISVTLNLIPTTGITLPFISFGGTSLIMVMFISGMILNISRYREHY